MIGQGKYVPDGDIRICGDAPESGEKLSELVYGTVSCVQINHRHRLRPKSKPTNRDRVGR
jgi:hypothetical protein